MPILEKWYGMTDSFGYATGFKSFSEIRQDLLEPAKAGRMAFMIHTSPNNEPAGFIYGQIKKMDIKTFLWINVLIIEPTFQHRGLGTAAVKKLLKLSLSQYGPFTCVVAVANRNIPGLMFWEKAGFFRSADMEGSLWQFGSCRAAIFTKTIKL